MTSCGAEPRYQARTRDGLPRNQTCNATDPSRRESAARTDVGISGR